MQSAIQNMMLSKKKPATKFSQMNKQKTIVNETKNNLLSTNDLGNLKIFGQKSAIPSTLPCSMNNSLELVTIESVEDHLHK